VLELEFARGAVEVLLLPELGARIHRLRAFGRDVLRTPVDVAEHHRDPFFWGAYPMAPWCNRVEATDVQVGSRRVSLASNFPDGWAIHGQVYAVPWTIESDGLLGVRAGGDGWPWVYQVRLRVELGETSLRLDYALSNESEEPMPGGLGVHPWFLRPLHLAIPAQRVFPTFTASEPEPVPVSGPFDLRERREMPLDLDATWADLSEPVVELAWPETGVSATMTVEAPTTYFVAASPRHLDAIALEPQTHAPQGLRRLLNGEPAGLAWLDPGKTLRLGVELSFRRA
jgi:aldose 1-epimerase